MPGPIAVETIPDMDAAQSDRDSDETGTTAEVRVRYWASAKAATGVAEERLRAATLADVVDEIRQQHGQAVDKVLRVASYLVDEQSVSGRDHADVVLSDGQVIDVLPPFAGG